MPLFSVVIPTHNRPEMLAEAIASVRAQTFSDYEIIVVSNGESREMRERSSQAIPDDARWFALDEGNVSAARNLGIEQSKGEWIAFLDDDDLWLPNKLERQVKEASLDRADMISSDYIEFYADGREILRQPRLLDGWSHTKALNHLFWWAAPSGVIVRRSVFGAVGGFNERHRYSEDNELWRRISWRHRIHHIDEVLFRYRQGHASMMQQQRRRYAYDIRLFVMMHRDTPRDLRSTLPDTSFVSRRVMIICFPQWLRRRLELNTWSGAQWHKLWESAVAQWHRLWPRAAAKSPRNDGPVIWTIRHPRKAFVRALVWIFAGTQRLFWRAAAFITRRSPSP